MKRYERFGKTIRGFNPRSPKYQQILLIGVLSATVVVAESQGPHFMLGGKVTVFFNQNADLRDKVFKVAVKNLEWTTTQMSDDVAEDIKKTFSPMFEKENGAATSEVEKYPIFLVFTPNSDFAWFRADSISAPTCQQDGKYSTGEFVAFTTIGATSKDRFSYLNLEHLPPTYVESGNVQAFAIVESVGCTKQNVRAYQRNERQRLFSFVFQYELEQSVKVPDIPNDIITTETRTGNTPQFVLKLPDYVFEVMLCADRLNDPCVLFQRKNDDDLTTIGGKLVQFTNRGMVGECRGDHFYNKQGVMHSELNRADILRWKAILKPAYELRKAKKSLFSRLWYRIKGSSSKSRKKKKRLTTKRFDPDTDSSECLMTSTELVESPEN